MARIIINLALRRLYFYKSTNFVKSYPVAIGKPSTPTPTGDWKIIAKIKHPGGILGTRWLGLDIPNGSYGIHGTPHPWTIGTAASLGCIRMYNHDIEELFPQVSIGTSVKIISSWEGSDTPPEMDLIAKPPSIPGSNQNSRTYIIKHGDTLWDISRRFNVNLNDLIQINNIPNPDLIHVGQKIIIPG
ncbi:MAG: L,D-transpeptidase family protein [Thermoanaerobacteraceae bacterium]|nr:L,D-transpeptidase family protein [Thermoanaerobacteraceae bacterium]